jgi:hypothetical protein
MTHPSLHDNSARHGVPNFRKPSPLQMTEIGPMAKHILGWHGDCFGN